MTSPLATPLALPCGAILANRICKAAMSEGLADVENHSTPRLEALYRRWAHSGAGLLLSGNVQIDRMHLERPVNVVLDDESGMEQLKALAKAGTEGGAHFWLQLSHTGRQVSDLINPAPLAPSCVEVDMPRALGTFAPPREMTEEEIAKTIEQFAFAAQKTKDAGFTGVQLHAAHGYLLSQFLSPLTNRRTDRWGGSLENRSRLLLNTMQSIRATVGQDFPIGIKLNSSDFQKGGFTHTEHIGVEDGLIALDGYISSRTGSAHGASVIDGNVEATETSDGLVDEVLESFDSGFVLMSRAYRRKKKSSRGHLPILSDFCASYPAGPPPRLFTARRGRNQIVLVLRRRARKRASFQDFPTTQKSILQWHSRTSLSQNLRGRGRRRVRRRAIPRQITELLLF
jgi:2,4-dienoyl-CoA reductase-like NADH-dependent reductase (Old Yellow Enzyme family)